MLILDLPIFRYRHGLFLIYGINKIPYADLMIRARNLKIRSYLSTKTFVVGAQKNRLNETVLLSTRNKCLN